LLQAIKKSLSLKVSIALALVTLPLTGVAAYVITARQTQNMEELTLNEGRLAATLGAKTYGTILEDAIDNGYLMSNEVFDQSYEEIRGYDWGSKPKFHTKYDFYTDRTVLGFQDRYLENPEFVYAIGVDVNGYLPTHNTVFSKPLTGDAATDLGGNRTKRKFDEPVGLRAAKNQDKILIQPYERDTGAKMWDVSSPILVKGKHWGAFRVGVSIDEIAHRKNNLIIQLGAIFGSLILLTAGAIFIMIKRSMRPLESLTALALEISTGEGLEKPVKPATTDEVGKMAKALDRLRISLRAAMERLGE
jgi:HAMP domain-containing protein